MRIVMKMRQLAPLVPIPALPPVVGRWCYLQFLEGLPDRQRRPLDDLKDLCLELGLPSHIGLAHGL